jgi:diaminopimelate epimerase
MRVKFEKWHGCKNDFLVVTLPKATMHQVVASLCRMAPNLCSKKGGAIGADGILVIAQDVDPQHTIHLTIVNADGSLASNCGNGLRCIAAFCFEQNLQHKDKSQTILNFQINDLVISCQKLSRRTSESLQYWISVNMGKCRISSDSPSDPSWMKEALQNLKPEKLSKNITKISAAEIGNRHIILTLTQANALQELEMIAKQIQTSSSSDGINVTGVISVDVPTGEDQKTAQRDVHGNLGELYQVQTWERGVGLTQACGSAACAVGALALSEGFVYSRDFIGIDCPGGRLYIRQSGSEITLIGPATKIFEGAFEL